MYLNFIHSKLKSTQNVHKNNKVDISDEILSLINTKNLKSEKIYKLQTIKLNRLLTHYFIQYFFFEII